MTEDVCLGAGRQRWHTVACERYVGTHINSATQNASWTSGSVTRGWLYGCKGAHWGEDFRLTDGEILLGSGWTSCIVLTSPEISRKHAGITVSSSRIEVEDLKSATGVWVNGSRVERAQLRDGDLVRIGHAEFLVVTVLPPKQAGEPPDVRRWFSSEVSEGRARVRGWLLVLGGGHTGQDFRLCEGVNRIGSDSGLEVSLLDSGVAPLHFEIEYRDGDFLFRRGGSSAAVLVNGEPALEGRTLRQGDVLKVGAAEIFLRSAP
jgi:pSer/pThr/pTyr-binding forkhead associated (FHA) protein